MKKNILFGLMVIALFYSGITIKAQQVLPPNLFSQNGWMPYVVGGGTDPTDSVQCPGLQFNLDCILYGSIDSNSNWTNVQNSKARLIRYGGISADQNRPTPEQYRNFVDSVRARGMEPILQIPLNFADTSTPYDTLAAKQIIQAVNDSPYNRNVVYWSIGNEPDHSSPQGYGYDTTTEVFLITTYIKNWSKAMRRAVPSVPIKICGPELASWKSEASYYKKHMVDSLLKPGASNRCDITGSDPVTGKPWIDVFSFHWYCGINGDDTSALARAKVIANLRKTNGFAETLDTLNVKLAAANSYHGRTANPIKSAVTEANIAYQSRSTDLFSGLHCNSFFAGQHWLEIASIAAEKGVEFVNFWSAAEGSMGYLKSDGTKKSTYCHFQKIAQNFSGVYYTASDQNSGGVAIKNIKAFGTKDANRISIVVMNQDSLRSPIKKRKFAINLNGSYTGITDTNQIKIGMSVVKIYVDSIEDATTVLLEFDLLGNLSQRYTYGQSASVSDCFTQPYCTTSATYTSQAQLNGYVPGVYSNITIGNGTSSWIEILSTNNSIYRAVDNITLKGNFKVPAGLSLSLIPTPCN